MRYLLLLLIINLVNCDITEFSGDTVFCDEICFEFPWYRNQSLFRRVTIENVFYNFTLKNNICNTFIVILPFYNWNLFCLNNCSDIIKPLSNMLWGICLKSIGNSTLNYTIIANYTITNPSPPEKSDRHIIIAICVGIGALVGFVVSYLIISYIHKRYQVINEDEKSLI